MNKPPIDPSKFRNKYRIASTRMSGRDYAATGRYFITICTKHRSHRFGEIRNGIIGLSNAGCIAWSCWEQIAIHYPWISLGAFIVMPNHVHGILCIGDRPETVETPYYGVSTGNKLQKPHAHHEWKSGTVGCVIHQFKRACTMKIRESGFDDFAWQPRFHDHIIRNNNAVAQITAYILTNPAKWERDRFFDNQIPRETP